MTGVTRVQTVSMGIDTADSSTSRAQAFGAAIASGNYMLVLFSTRDSSPGNYTVSDSAANSWNTLPFIYDSNGGRGVGGAWCLGNAASNSSAPTVTINKNGTGGSVGGTMFELNAPSGTFLDVTPITDNQSSTHPQVTLGSTAYTNDLIIAVLCTGPTSFTTATPLTNYTAATTTLNSSGSAIQHAVVARDTTVTGAYTPGWTLSVGAQWQVLGLAIRGTTTAATITGSSTATPNNLGSVTFTGVNFGASQGSVTIGSVAQTVTAWSDTSITVTVVRGGNGYGNALNVVATTAAAAVSNSFALTGLLPQTGWQYLTAGTPNATAANRLTATGGGDIVAGDQIAWGNLVGGSVVNVYADSSFSYGAGVTAFDYEVWNNGNGWGTVGTETFGTGSVKNAVAHAFSIRASSDTKFYSAYPAGDHP